MSERAHENRTKALLTAALPGVHLWKIHDSVTVGVPDLEVAWNEYTTKFEFKLLKGTETVHDKWRPGQLETCIKYEGATRRCWVIAFRRLKGGAGETIIYRPSALRNGALPEPADTFPLDTTNGLTVLWSRGAARFDGIAYDRIIELVKGTHR